MPVFWELLIIVLLVLLNGFFAMSELAVVSSRRARLKQLSDEGSRGAASALRLADDPGGFLSTVQVGITLIGVLTGAFSGATLAGKLEVWLAAVPGLAGMSSSVAFAIVVVGITALSLIAGELVPKRIALSNAERVAAAVARPMALLSRVAAPVVWLLRIISEGLLRLLGLPTTRQVTVTEEEVRSLIAEGAEAGVFEVAERDMIDSVLRLADRPVRSIMTPRIDVVWLDVGEGADDVRRQIAESGRSRFPVGRETIDALEGVVHAKDILEQLMRGEALDLLALAKPPLYVHDGTPVLKLLELLRSAAVPMALVVDEYGSFEGIVTPANILSAIAGEFPGEEGDADDSAVRRADGSWLLDGRLSIDEVERILDRRDMQSEDDYHTLAGFVLWKLGHLPVTGEVIQWRDLRFEVVDMDGRRIDRLLVSPAEPGSPQD